MLCFGRFEHSHIDQYVKVSISRRMLLKAETYSAMLICTTRVQDHSCHAGGLSEEKCGSANKALQHRELPRPQSGWVANLNFKRVYVKVFRCSALSSPATGIVSSPYAKQGTARSATVFGNKRIIQVRVHVLKNFTEALDNSCSLRP